MLGGELRLLACGREHGVWAYVRIVVAAEVLHQLGQDAAHLEIAAHQHVPTIWIHHTHGTTRVGREL
jgi:hypothetical protein